MTTHCWIQDDQGVELAFSSARCTTYYAQHGEVTAQRGLRAHEGLRGAAPQKVCHTLLVLTAAAAKKVVAGEQLATLFRGVRFSEFEAGVITTLTISYVAGVFGPEGPCVWGFVAVPG